MEPIKLHYTVPGDDFTRAGEASADLKARLKKLGLPSDAVRRVAIALYEGGSLTVDVRQNQQTPQRVLLLDTGLTLSQWPT